MAKTLELPALGNSMEEGTITRWFKAEGEAVGKGEALYEVMTDKVNMEVEATEAGTLLKILAAVDEIVPVNGPVAILGAPGEDVAGLLGGTAIEEPTPAAEPQLLVAALPSPPAPPALGPNGADARVFASPRARRYADEYGVDIALLLGRGTGVDGRVVEADVVAFYEEQQANKQDAEKAQRVSPLAARVAAAHGVPVGEVPGSGHGGKVTQGDVRRLVAPDAPAPVSPPPPPIMGEKIAPRPPILGESEQAGDVTVVRLTGMRKMVADAVARSAQAAPHVTLTLAVDMAEATRFRRQILPTIEKTHGVRVSFTDLIAKASARALLDHPYLNSTLTGGDITLHRRVHLGVAVSLGTDGLIVPVVKDAQAKSLGEFSAALKGLVSRAKAGTLASDDVTGGTFSLTNLGTFGVTQFNPIIVPPQAAILGVCAIQDTLIPVDGVPQVRPLMNLCLSFDHRVTDGAPAAAFLARLKEILEQPYLMFA